MKTEHAEPRVLAMLRADVAVVFLPVTFSSEQLRTLCHSATHCIFATTTHN